MTALGLCELCVRMSPHISISLNASTLRKASFSVRFQEMNNLHKNFDFLFEFVNLRSATTGTLLLPRVRTSTGQRSFAVFGLATWNRLPPSLRAPELSLSTFKRLLKIQLFEHA